ncbi:flavin-containing monooxygenase [Deinococcus humi]|uniref:Putative flavoprotein involved in K+ transport n=1 Tax=Deinococcus humi TaxID=662880 RepID=A0A7W8JWN5_9DEIO|nr:NAD(P)/FAD-dependent oxidoreductase [Deinococcus humi]MBB5363039.1 putative flavoprotein involved in K+ transport [Deinococcus humi]GGO24987.1 monooxygenase [Deinococcus humi]
MLDAVVIGAGSAGLAAAYSLQRRHLSFEVLEAGAAASGSWPEYYDSLTLFTPAHHSALPGLPFGGDPHHYPSRGEMIAYLQTYAAHFSFPVRRGAQVVAVRHVKKLFEITARDGRTWTARAVICASGTFGQPHWPHLSRAGEFQGQALHASQYRRPVPFAGQRVIVVGAGNSAAQIAAELGQVARVTLAVRRAPQLFPQRPLGRDLTDWLAWTGIEKLPLGVLGRVPDVHPVVAVPGLRAALSSDNPDLRPLFEGFTRTGVRWSNGQEEAVDSVIYATGYRWNGEYLPLAALDRHGEPQQRLGISTALPGLAFVGLPGQRTAASSTIRSAGPDAEYVVARLSEHLENPLV